MITFSNVAQAVRTALLQVGYREGQNKDGSWNNIQKYSPAVPGLEWSQGQPWCATFVSWLALQAGLASIYPRSASVPAIWNWGGTTGIRSDYPAIGALAIFGNLQHVGWVVWFDRNYIWTVEGNTNDNGSPEGNGVYLKQHLRTDPWVHGYVLPNPAALVLPSADPAYNAAHARKVGTKAADASSALLNPADLQRAGIKALGQYLSDYPVKNITRAKAINYAKYGIGSFLFWENNKGDALKGYDQGVADAKKAIAQADALGVDKNIPIHFAVDQDATWEQVAPYFKGAHSVAVDRTGCYGSFYITAAARANGIKFTVQTEGWSTGLHDPYANAIQWARTPQVPGTDDESIINAMPTWAPTATGSTPPTAPTQPSIPADQLRAADQQVGLIKHYAANLAGLLPGTPRGNAARQTVTLWKDIA